MHAEAQISRRAESLHNMIPAGLLDLRRMAVAYHAAPETVSMCTKIDPVPPRDGSLSTTRHTAPTGR